MRNDPDERSRAWYAGYDAGRRQGVKAFAEYLSTTCWTVVQREKLPSFATEFLAANIGGGDDEENEQDARDAKLLRKVGGADI